jgi:hypothetical protein
MSYDLGAIVPLSVTITDSAGTPANAGSVVVTITLPDATTATPAVTNPQTGVYHADYATTQAGRHTVRWVATGANAAAHTDVFEVLAAAPPQIISLKDAKKQLNIPETNTTDDAEVLDFVRATTGICERYAGKIVRETFTETHDGGKCTLLLRHLPVLTISSVTENGSTLASSGYALKGFAGVLTRMLANYQEYPFLPGRQNIVVTLVAGTTSTSPDVGQASRIILQHLWETQRPAGGGPFSQQGEEFDPRYLYSIPRRALELLGEPIGGIA